MSEQISVQPWLLRAAAGASRDVGASLVKANDETGHASQACASGLSGFASASAFGAIAALWHGQVKYISDGYTQAGNDLDLNATAHEQTDQTAAGQYQPQG